MKKKEGPTIIEESDIIDFNALEDDIKEGKDIDPEEIERNFILIIPQGCPICGEDVKGNDHYLYFCKNCNVLFERKDIMDKEFGRKPLSRIRLNNRQREELQRKRDELKERIHKAFSGQEVTVTGAPQEIPDQEDDIGKTEDDMKEDSLEQQGDAAEHDEEQDDQETDIEKDTQENVAEEIEAEIVSPGDRRMPSLDDLAGAISGHRLHDVGPEVTEEDTDSEDTKGSADEDDEMQEEDAKQQEDMSTDDIADKEEYEVESADKIIASNQSTKMHKGDCHFVRKIHPENRIYLDSITHGEDSGYELCVCLRRLKAMKR
ncbi:MAG: hypothetical protein V1729_02445 [Candidatus Woesearchaeota archaeon]